MLGVHIKYPNRHTPCSVSLQHMDRGEKGDTLEVRGRKREKAQDSQAAHGDKEGYPGGARLHSNPTGRPESPETGTDDKKVGKGKGRGLETEDGQTGRGRGWGPRRRNGG